MTTKDLVVATALLFLAATTGERALAQSNLPPNPFESVLDWSRLPDGRTWGQMAALAIDSSGNVWAVERCGGSR